jgi:hypothetical protein
MNSRWPKLWLVPLLFMSVVVGTTYFVVRHTPGGHPAARSKTESDMLYEYLRSRHAALSSFYSAEHRYPGTEEFAELFKSLQSYPDLQVDLSVSEDTYAVSVRPIKPGAPISVHWVLRPNGLWSESMDGKDAPGKLVVSMQDSGTRPTSTEAAAKSF